MGWVRDWFWNEEGKEWIRIWLRMVKEVRYGLGIGSGMRMVRDGSGLGMVED
jgi:hypothetical protein